MRLVGSTPSLMPGEQPKSVAMHERVPLGLGNVGRHHLAHEVVESNRRFPAKRRACLARVSDQAVDLRRPEITRIDPYPAHSVGVLCNLIRTSSAPFQLDSCFACGRLDELANAVLLTSG